MISLNKYAAIFIPIITVLIAQVIKYIIALLKGNMEGYSVIAGTGRMPSGHSALTTSILVYYIYKAVFKNASFDLVGIALVLWLVVLRDAVGVRKEVERHSKIINENILKKNVLSENQGHTILEVFVGGIIGIIVPIIYIILFCN